MSIAAICLVLIAALCYWELFICEGAHLGRKFVVRLYDLTASRYDKIKGFDEEWERRYLGEPLAMALAGLPGALLLDVGAGTGRAARALMPNQKSDPTLVSLEPSRGMLALGRRLANERVHWVRGWSVPLPFAEETFDLVVSLEILEFTPQPRETLLELQRVLRRGGWLLVTNRVGRQAPLIFGHTWSRQAFPGLLEGIGFQNVDVYPWQMEYDLAWARKPWDSHVKTEG